MLEEMVRAEVERQVARMLPLRRESPRVESPRELLAPADFLRLGYGARTPTN